MLACIMESTMTIDYRLVLKVWNNLALHHRTSFSLSRRHIVHIDFHSCCLLNELDSQHKAVAFFFA